MSTHWEIYRPPRTHCVLKKKLELRLKCMSFAERKQNFRLAIDSYFNIRCIISFHYLSLWNIQMHSTINHEVNSLQSNCLNKADQPIGDRCCACDPKGQICLV